MNLVILGLGYTASYYAGNFAGEFANVTGTVRTPRAAAVGSVTLLAFDSEVEPIDPRLVAAIAQADCLLVSAGPDQQGDPILRRLQAFIAAAPKLQRIVYLSTIGVYGDRGGASVDEKAELNPVSPRSAHRVQAETAWRHLAEENGKRLFILRLSGIYGPGRNVLLNLRAGVSRRIVKPGQVFNRIHVADIGRAIEKCFRGDAPAGVYNVTDNEPAPPQDVIAYAADLMGIRPPPEQDFASADLTPMARSFYGENKRVANVKMRDILGISLQFPTYREALTTLWAGGEGRT